MLPAEQGAADGLRVVPAAVMVFVLLDLGASVIIEAFGTTGMDLEGWLNAAQMLLVALTLAATMYHRPRTAVLLAAAVAVLALTVGATGGEPWVIVVSAVTAVLRGTRRQLALVTAAQVGYAACYAVRAEVLEPGWGWVAGVVMLGITAIALAAGGAIRLLLLARDRRRDRVRRLEQENAEIRVVERARLADDLQTVVTRGLATIEQHLEPTGPTAGADTLRASLTRVDDDSRSLLTELRSLLSILRGPSADGPPAAAVPGRRRRHVRFAATAVVVLAVVASLAAAGHWDTGYWDIVSTSLLCLLGALWLGPRRLWLVLVPVAAYAALVASTVADDRTTRLLLLWYAGFLAIVLGLAARHLASARADSLRRMDDLEGERDRVGPEERTAVARELHDVVAHQLSVTTMLVMATSLSEDPRTLAVTLDKVRRSTSAAHQELSTLVHTMRADTGGGQPAPLATPSATARALGDQLSENGHHPDLEIDPRADELDVTTQRTLARIMQEATTNILRYAPAASVCRYTVAVDDDVRLSVVSPTAAGERASDLSLGWGLRGVRERVELTRGTFTAGPEEGRWVLSVTLPVVPEAEGVDRPSSGVLRGLVGVSRG